MQWTNSEPGLRKYTNETLRPLHSVMNDMNLYKTNQNYTVLQKSPNSITLHDF